MNQQQIRLGLALKESGLPLAVDEFDDRLTLQKGVYLLQESGIHLGYRYRWYLRGPYSSDLTTDAFLLSGLSDKGDSELNCWELDSHSHSRAGKLKKLFLSKPAEELPKHLELLASVLFLIRTGQGKKSDSSYISQILKANEKPFNKEDVELALVELQHHGFFT
jgi:hypothetical protein